MAVFALSVAFTAVTVSFALSSPLPRSFIPRFFLLRSFFSTSASRVISVIPASANFCKSERFTSLYCFLKITFENPLSFGILLKSGVCPPSNQSGTPPPDLAFCPLQPLQEYVPLPEPFPLPSLLEVCLDPAFGLSVFVLSIFPFLLIYKFYCLNDVRALIAALALLIRFPEPYLFASTSVYPATERTFLTAPPAIRPVPADAG
jgi:hypothetical protein